jgi:hypothetical protein
MTITTRAIKKGIPPRVHEPSGGSRRKGNVSTVSSDSEESRPVKQKGGKKRHIPTNSESEEPLSVRRREKKRRIEESDSEESDIEMIEDDLPLKDIDVITVETEEENEVSSLATISDGHSQYSPWCRL